MQVIFTLASSTDATKLAQFLSENFQVEIGNCLDYTTLSVKKQDVIPAISAGSSFIRQNHIRQAWWIAEAGLRMPLDNVPIIFGELPENFKNSKFLAKLVKFLCNRYAKKYEKYFGIPVIWEYTPDLNVQFSFIPCNKAIEQHQHYQEQAITYCLVHRHIFDHILVTNDIGQAVYMVTKYLGIRWPVKTPH